MAVKLGTKTLPLPIVQGGMGVGISLDRQVRRAKELAHGAGLVAVNAMVASVQYADSVRTALKAGVDAVVSGAGLPLQLPAIAAEVPDCTAALAPWREKYGRDIPVFVAGGVEGGGDMARYMKEGAAGAQFATRFIATQECDAGQGYKDILLRGRAEDVTIVKSPVGLPGRALRSPLIQRVEAGTQPRPSRCVNCLAPCKKLESPYCISQALIDAWHGDWDNGLFFCGANVGQVDAMSNVEEQMDQIMTEWRAAQ